MNDSFEASSYMPSDAELASRTDTWSRLLFGIVPEERLPDAFQLAFQMNTTRQAVNAYDLKNAWQIIEAEEKAQAAKNLEEDKKINPVKYCPQKALHINDDGEIYHLLGGVGGIEVVVPCMECRKNQFYRRVEEEKTKHADKLKFKSHKEVLKNIQQKVDKIMVKPKPEKLKEPVLSTEELQQIQGEYHSLVSELVEDEQARKNLIIVWDEGAEVFKYPERADVLFSVKDIQRKIEDYKKRIAERRAA